MVINIFNIFLILLIISIISIIKVDAYTSIHQDFELDGNTEASGDYYTSNGDPKDWVYFTQFSSVPDNSWTSGIIIDPGTTTTFEQSAKDTKDISLWLWGPDNNAQAKTDIYHVMAYAKKYVNDLIIYFGADRVGGSGISANSAFGFWFVQDPLFGISGVSSGSFTGTHFPGDLLITANFANPPYIELFQWSGYGSSGSLLSLGSLNQKCNSSISQSICAIFNEQPSFTSIPFETYTTYTYPETTFMEGGINIGAWLNTSNLYGNNLPCYSKILSMTRTSTSTSATLKDFGMGDFELCITDASNICDENTVIMTKLDNGTTLFTYYYTIVIDQTGVGNIYDVQITIPDGYNDEGSNAITYISEVSANSQESLTFHFTRSDSNSITIPTIYMSYCFFPSCSPPYRRNVTADQIVCTKPTLSPTFSPSFNPSYSPTKLPTSLPSSLPSRLPSIVPSYVPSKLPSQIPSLLPSYNPTKIPSYEPTYSPSKIPSLLPSKIPSYVPTLLPSKIPSLLPSLVPSKLPTSLPSKLPSKIPSLLPTASPVTSHLLLNVYCNVSINNNYCYEFNWYWNLCNYGDRIVYNINITSSKDYNYQYIISYLNVNECKNSSVNYQPIRYDINSDPILNNNIWNDNIYAIGSMFIRGNDVIYVSTSSFFNCPICV